MEYFKNRHNAGIVGNIIRSIQENKVYLSDIDGAIGDGDHGINMNKGFSMAEAYITAEQSFSEAMKIVGDILLLEIGGTMGPIYGTFFLCCAQTIEEHQEIRAPLFAAMLTRALQEVQALGGAEVGDKTLIDTLSPAVAAFIRESGEGQSFRQALDSALKAAEAGKDSTRAMVAKLGRASRLGERSAGVLDAGAVSCYLILKAMFESISSVLFEINVANISSLII
jgi:dihydroxyacetone kinase-like protein